MMVIYIKQHLEAIEAKFMKKLRNTEAELKKVVYKKKECNLFKKHFHFYSKSKVKILNDFAFLLHFEIVWFIGTITSIMFRVLPLFYFTRYNFPKYGLVFMWHVVKKNKFGKVAL